MSVDHAPIERAAQAVTRHLGQHFPPHMRDDILQESLLVGLEMANYYKPSRGRAEPYYYRGMVTAVGALVHKWLSATSISRAVAKAGLAGRLQIRVPAEKVIFPVESPEDAALEVEGLPEARLKAAAARVRWRREVERALRRLPNDARQVGALMVGLEGPAMDTTEIVKATGLWRDQVQRAALRVRHALSSSRAGVLWEALQEAEAVLP